MNIRNAYLSLACFLISGMFLMSFGQQDEGSFIYGDMLPDAPELAARGSYKVGVRTIDLVHKNQIDILGQPKGLDTIMYYDRPLKIEVWYPAILDENEKDTYYNSFFDEINNVNIQKIEIENNEIMNGRRSLLC
jgi:hypothetical protein